VKAQCVQTAFKQIHSHEHTDRCKHEHVESEEQAHEVAANKAGAEAHVEEHLGQLAVCQRQSPQTQVGGRVGNGTEHELNRLNALVNEQFTERVGGMTEIACLGNNIFVEAEGVFCIDNSRMMVFEAVIVMVIGVDVWHGLFMLLMVVFMFILVIAIDVVHH